ncbi:unnamed protein product [Polarella glacialis]|uniref:Uncharacterized protein n=1 Tax=Polarella glacialis TaxID=89957 RepID=A0A813KF22_POLGL|nr:unnamed protein product [Polarella glacialis]|mmetsp:Transcript_65900/g.118791  ORF Transcript_65900/g.118791 Transcript_65900/m.118791 type:complete len:248 (+) Transcript_65900:111-854(+)
MAPIPPDDLDRWVQFCNNTEAWDKVWKVCHAGVRCFVNVVPNPELRANVDFMWRYILDGRKVSWMFKWIKELQGFRAALRQPGDDRVVRLRAMVRLWFAGRWIFENLHIMTKMLPNGKGNFLKVKDPMRLNRLAKFCWEGALLSNLAVDLMVLRIAKQPETAEERLLRRLRLVNYFGDSMICCNMMQVPQMVSKFLFGREMAFLDSWVGLNGTMAALCQCYFVFPARPLPAIAAALTGPAIAAALTK